MHIDLKEQAHGEIERIFRKMCIRDSYGVKLEIDIGGKQVRIVES